MLNGVGAALSGNLIRIACSFSRCLHASIAAGRVSKRRPIVVIPWACGLPGKQTASPSKSGTRPPCLLVGVVR